MCMSGSVEVCGVRDVRSRLRSTQRSDRNLVTGHIDPDGGVKLGVKSGEDAMCSTYRQSWFVFILHAVGFFECMT